MNPYGLDSSPICGEVPGGNTVSVGALPLLATSTQEYDDAVTRTITLVNNAYHEFLRSDEGHCFSGQVCVLGNWYYYLSSCLNYFILELLFKNLATLIFLMEELP